MATKKDLVEAYSFSRRRLVTAFVSGAPGGREVEPSRPGRTIIGGVALAILLVAAGAVLGFLKPQTDVDWDTEMLVGEKESGADFVNIASEPDGELLLRSVVNFTSAMLLLGPDVESTQVPHDEIADQPPGEPIGILEAPPTPPDTSALIQSGWTGCTGQVDGTPVGLRVAVYDDPGVTPTPDTSFVVVTPEQELFLIAESPRGWERPQSRAYVYPVPNDSNADRILLNVAGVNSDSAISVPDEFLTMFPSGGELSLSTFGLGRKLIGRPSPRQGESTIPGRAKVGDLLEAGGVPYVLTKTGVLLLDPFALEVYQGSFEPGSEPEPTDIGVAPDGDIASTDSLPAANWPTRTTTEIPVGQICAVLDAVDGAAPGVVLGHTEPGTQASADQVLVGGEPDVGVDYGHGAFVLSGDWDAQGPAGLQLVDDRGLAHALAGDAERFQLGYSGVPDRVVPDAWIDLLRDGVPLSIDAARCPPTSQERTGPCG